MTAALPAPQGPAGAGHLAAVLKQNGTPLRLLSMRRNAIGDDGAAAFAAALETNTALDTLILAQNGISDGGGKKIFVASDESCVFAPIRSIIGDSYNMLPRVFQRSHWRPRSAAAAASSACWTSRNL